MTDRWFQIRDVGSGTMSDPHRPEHVRDMGLDWAGNKTAPSGAPWIVHVYGSVSELDTLAGQSGTTELSSVPTDALNKMLDQNRTAGEWSEAFNVTS